MPHVLFRKKGGRYTGEVEPGVEKNDFAVWRITETGEEVLEGFFDDLEEAKKKAQQIAEEVT